MIVLLLVNCSANAAPTIEIAALKLVSTERANSAETTSIMCKLLYRTYATSVYKLNFDITFRI